MKTSFVALHDWVFDVLNISGNDAIIFSYILGFKSKGYFGSVDTLSSKFRLSSSTTNRCLKGLTSKQLLTKEKEKQFVRYKANAAKIEQLQNEFCIKTNVEKIDDDSIFDKIMGNRHSENDKQHRQNDIPTRSKDDQKTGEMNDNKIPIKSFIKPPLHQSVKNEVEGDFKKEIYVPPSLIGKGYYKFILTDFDWDRDWKDVRKIGDFLKPQFGNDIKMGAIETVVNQKKEFYDIKSNKAFFVKLVHDILKPGAVPANGKMETL